MINVDIRSLCFVPVGNVLLFWSNKSSLIISSLCRLIIIKVGSVLDSCLRPFLVSVLTLVLLTIPNKLLRLYLLLFSGITEPSCSTHADCESDAAFMYIENCCNCQFSSRKTSNHFPTRGNDF